MKIVTEKTITFEMVDILEIFEKNNLLSDATKNLTFKMEMESNPTEFFLVGRKSISPEEIEGVVRSELKKNGNDGDFTIDFRNETVVCTQLYTAVLSEAKNSGDILLDRELTELIGSDHPHFRLLSVRLRNCIKNESANHKKLTLRSFLNSNYAPRNFGKKTFTELANALTDSGIDPQQWPLSKRFS